MEVDRARNPERERNHESARRKAEGAEDAGQNPALRHEVARGFSQELPRKRGPGVDDDEADDAEERRDVNHHRQAHDREARGFSKAAKHCRFHLFFSSPKRRAAYQAQRLKTNVMRKSTSPVA